MDFDLIFKDRIKIDDIDTLVIDLKKIVGDKWVSTEHADLVAYAKDSMLISFRWIQEGKLSGLPHVVTWPETDEEISEILKVANERKIPVIPYGEGSGVVGAAIPIHGGIMIDMKRVNNIIEINDSDLTVTVQAGMNGKALERALEQEGYLIGHVPQSFHTSSVGGWIAHRAAGQFSTKYGKIEDIILDLRVVLPTGEIIDTKRYPRAANGPQVDRMFLGSEGTLGIVTKATMKIWPLPEKQAGIGYAFNDLEHALEAVRHILRKQIYPAVVRIYDEIETSRHFYKEDKAKGKLMIVFVCEGITQLVDLELNIIHQECKKQDGIDCGNEPVEHWFETRFDVKDTSKWSPKGLIFDTIEVSCMWHNATDLYESVMEKMQEVPGMTMVSAHASHFYPQGVGFYFTFGGTAVGDDSPEKFYKNAWNAAMEGTLAVFGSIAHHHGVGITRAHWMKEEHGELLQVMKNIKAKLDPNNIMNPRKLYDKVW